MGLQAVFLCPKQRPWVFSDLVIFDNRVWRDTQGPNGRLGQISGFRNLVQYLGPRRGLLAYIIDNLVEKSRATLPNSPNPTRSPACAHTAPQRPNCPQPSAPKKMPHNSLANHDSCIGRGLSSAKFDVSRSKIAKWPNEV